MLVAFVMTIFGAVGSGGNAAKSISDGYNSGGSAEAIAFSLVVAAIAALSGLVLLVLSIFVGNALEVGGCRFFITNQTEQAQAGTLAYGVQIRKLWKYNPGYLFERFVHSLVVIVICNTGNY